MTWKEEVKVHFKTILAFVWSDLGNPRKIVRVSCTGRNYNTEIRSSTRQLVWSCCELADWVAGRLSGWEAD